MPEHNITIVQQRIFDACTRYGRDPDSVKLLAVSKTRDVATIQRARNAGLRCFGENYTREAEQKISQLPDDIEWHFIGPVQSNKTRFIAASFSWIHSIDRIKIARRLNAQRPADFPPLQCLIQINISRDPAKSGIMPEALPELAKAFEDLPQLLLRGLMAIPAAGQSTQALENDFANMAQLLRQLQTLAPQADTLSMGMSADLELAIKHGSTLVRIGTDIFGARQ